MSTSNSAYGNFYGPNPASRSGPPGPGAHQSHQTRATQKPPLKPDYRRDQHRAHDDHHDARHPTQRNPQHQIQTMAPQRQRSKQASKQMAYDVFGNVITAMETFEKRQEREGKDRAFGTSNISIPSQSRKNQEDVKASVEAQLRVFEQHMKHCPEDVRREIRPQLKQMTADWMAARGPASKATKTDLYAANLFEIVGKGSTTHDDSLLRDQRQMGKAELLDNFGKVARGQAQADEVDRMFEHDPHKTAKAPEVRKGASTTDGLERLANIKPGLVNYMDDVPVVGSSAR